MRFLQKNGKILNFLIFFDFFYFFCGCNCLPQAISYNVYTKKSKGHDVALHRICIRIAARERVECMFLAQAAFGIGICFGLSGIDI